MFIYAARARGSLRGVVVNVLDHDIVVSEFKLQSQYYVYFQTNTLGKAYPTIIRPGMVWLDFMAYQPLQII